jgi:hypothetical protein
MLSQTDQRAHNEHDRKRRGSQLHIPLGSHDVPLLDHAHQPLNFARLHHVEVPLHHEPGFAHYRAARDGALANAVRTFEKELGIRSGVEYLEILNEKLIVRHYSQSKLSQQELADLQKATHFDKKELQQWYKGARLHATPSAQCLSNCRLPQGLPVGHAHQGGVPEDLQAVLPLW